MHHSVQRATRETLGTGDVQVTLRWKGQDDVDLHVIDPYGQRVFFGNQQVAGGGRLDLDMNAGAPPWETDSVENVYWPFGAAPQGEYRVIVHHYRRNGGPDAIPFKLRILNKGVVTEKTGVARYVLPRGGQTNNPNNGTLDAVNALQAQQTFATFSVATPPDTILFLRPVQWLAILVVGLWVAALFTTLSSVLLGQINSWYREQSDAEPRNPNVDRAQFLDEDEGRRVTQRALAWSLLHGALAQAAFGLVAFWIPTLQEACRVGAWLAFAAWSGGRLGRLFPAHLPFIDARKGGIYSGIASGLFFSFCVVGGSDSLFYGADTLGRLVGALLIGGWIGWMVQLPVWAAPIREPEQEASSSPSGAEREAVGAGGKSNFAASSEKLAATETDGARESEGERPEPTPPEWKDTTWQSNPGLAAS